MADHKMEPDFLVRIRQEAETAVKELLLQAKLQKGDILVVGCSSSEVTGQRIGTFSSIETAQAVFDGIYETCRRRKSFWQLNAASI